MKNLILFLPALFILISCNKPEIGPEVSETYFVRTEGADMPVYVRGNTASNKFILVIHGGPGGEAYTYTLGRFADLLGEDHALLLWDQRGQGASQGHYSSDIIDIERMRLDLKAVALATRERYGEDAKLYFMGHSWGGLLGTAFAQSEDQDLMDGWIEVAGAHDLPLLYSSAFAMLDTIGDRELLAGRETEFWNEVKDSLAVLPQTNATVDQWLSLNSLGHRAEQLLPEIDEPGGNDISISEAFFRNPQDAFALRTSAAHTGSLLIDEVLATDLSPTMDQIQVSTLLLWGRYDFVVPPALGLDAFPRIGTPDKEIWIFERSGHSPMFNQPDEFVQVVEDWIARH